MKRCAALMLVVIGVSGCAQALRPQERRQLAIGVAGTGALSLGIAGAMGFQARNKRDAAREQGCTPDLSLCPTDAIGIAEAAHSRGNWATGLGIGGALMIVGGTVLYFTTPDDAPPRRKWQVAPTVGTDQQAGVALSGRF